MCGQRDKKMGFNECSMSTFPSFLESYFGIHCLWLGMCNLNILVKTSPAKTPALLCAGFLFRILITHCPTLFSHKEQSPWTQNYKLFILWKLILMPNLAKAKLKICWNLNFNHYLKAEYTSIYLLFTIMMFNPIQWIVW